MLLVTGVSSGSNTEPGLLRAFSQARVGVEADVLDPDISAATAGSMLLVLLLSILTALEGMS